MVANLRNVDEDFARRVADGLRLDPLPEASTPARPPIADLPPSPALSIVANGPDSFAGRKIGVLVTDGADAALLQGAAQGGGGRGRARRAGRPAHRRRRHQRRQLHAGPPEDRRRPVGALRRRRHPRLGRGRRRCSPSDAAAKDFVTDAHAHCKFIGYTADSPAAARRRRPRRAARRRLHRARQAGRRDHVRRALPRRAATGPAGCRSPPPTAPEGHRHENSATMPRSSSNRTE